MNEPTDLGRAHLRVVRPSDDPVANVTFYCDGLGFEVLYEFRDHDGFDAVMLSCSNMQAGRPDFRFQATAGESPSA